MLISVKNSGFRSVIALLKAGVFFYYYYLFVDGCPTQCAALPSYHTNTDAVTMSKRMENKANG